MEKQHALIKYLVEKCTKIPEVKALYLKGSIARNTGDAFSDVDFYCLVDETFVGEMLQLRMDILNAYKQILFMEHVNFGAPQVIVIYEDNIHLDFYTVHDVPIAGADSIKVLYDPKMLLNQYKIEKVTVEKSEVIENLNNIIYTAQEVYAAYCRKDTLWCDRLLSHMITDLGVVYCVLLQPDKPVVHLKGVWHSLPETIRHDLNKIMEVSTPNRYAEASILLLEHCLKLIDREFRVFQDSIYIGYLKYMIGIFNKLSVSA